MCRDAYVIEMLLLTPLYTSQFSSPCVFPSMLETMWAWEGSVIMWTLLKPPPLYTVGCHSIGCPFITCPLTSLFTMAWDTRHVRWRVCDAYRTQWRHWHALHDLMAFGAKRTLKRQIQLSLWHAAGTPVLLKLGRKGELNGVYQGSWGHWLCCTYAVFVYISLGGFILLRACGLGSISKTSKQEILYILLLGGYLWGI